MLGRTMTRECGVQRRLPRFGLAYIRVGALLPKKLAEPPVAVKSGGIESHVVSQRRQRFALCEQESYGGDVAIVGAPLDERGSVFGLRPGRISLGHIFEHQVGTSFGDSLQHEDSPAMGLE